MYTWGYHLDKHLDEFEDTLRISKDAKILDVAAGTGIIGDKVIFCLLLSEKTAMYSITREKEKSSNKNTNTH